MNQLNKQETQMKRFCNFSNKIKIYNPIINNLMKMPKIDRFGLLVNYQNLIWGVKLHKIVIHHKNQGKLSD